MENIHSFERQFFCRGYLLCAFFLGGLFMSTLVSAQNVISLSESLQKTLENNLELNAYSYRFDIAESEAVQASLGPVPEISFSAENILGSGANKGADNAEFSLVLSQLVELGGKQASRAGVAGSLQYQQRAEYEVSRLDALAETSRRYYRVLRLQALLLSVSTREKQEQQALLVIRRRAQAGSVGEADVAKMVLTLARSQSFYSQLQDEMALAKSRLAAMWLGVGEFDIANGSLASLPELPDAVLVQQAIENSPLIIKQQALLRIADAQLQLQRSSSRRDVTFEVGMRQLERTGDQGFIVGVSVPLSWKNPNRGRLAAAEVQRDLAEWQVSQSNTVLELTLLEIQQRLMISRNSVERISIDLLPKAKLLLEHVKKGYQQGRYSVLQWVDAQAELFNLEAQLIDMQYQVFMQLLELERISGQAMSVAQLGER